MYYYIKAPDITATDKRAPNGRAPDRRAPDGRAPDGRRFALTPKMKKTSPKQPHIKMKTNSHKNEDNLT